MNRILIVGIDTAAGRSLADKLSETCDLAGLWFSTPTIVSDCAVNRINRTAISEQVAWATTVVFCGAASQSSWNRNFGTFRPEDKWLTPCVQAAKASGGRMVFVSSDAVFSGPWVFHDDDSVAHSEESSAQQLRRFEAQVQTLKNSLIVRTNIVDGKGVVQDAVRAVENGRSVSVDASTYATPVVQAVFASSLVDCLAAGMTGYVNIAGAERTSPYQLVTQLAANLECDSRRVIAKFNTEKPVERSLRCLRLQHELKQRSSMLKDTLEHLADTVTTRENRVAAA
ncbi:MAG: sugar nucleotide-binding protein [Fuerstiella sp.]|nr:sugar nucleotide-binding protein [Fuerstiella sp.]MCP4787198.1 sugar nucleotide-binding protein [Fuerstiella sp.]MCP4855206.1 sugar nucleotide-binding protein [Fuerstiella sp.]